MCPSATWGLAPSAADEALFVDRATEATTIRKTVDLALNTFLTGPPGSGKTSLLRHIKRRLDDPSGACGAREPRGRLGGPPQRPGRSLPVTDVVDGAATRRIRDHHLRWRRPWAGNHDSCCHQTPDLPNYPLSSTAEG